MIINAIKEYIEKCPYLSEFSKGININFLDDEISSYSIETIPINPIIKRYIDGSSIRQYLFLFCSKESYGQEVLQNIQNSGFFEKFTLWIEKNNKQGILPSLNDGREAIKIEVLTTGYPFQTDIDRARYQIQLKLEYFQKGGNDYEYSKKI